MTRPAWLDEQLYPYADRFFATPAGSLHYLDEGEGSPVVMVHGNPGWSFEYRHVIDALSPTHRCIAVDHLGFGLSDKPEGFDYRPQSHAASLAALLDSLDLHDVTLVVSDWGGPIGLSWALANPDRLARVVIMNTWMWSVKADLYYQGFSGFMGGPLGRLLIRRYNFFARSIVKSAVGVKDVLTPTVHRHYMAHLDTPEHRRGSYTFPKQIIAASEWLESLWRGRGALDGVPVSIVWGMKDIAFRPTELARWEAGLPHPTVTRLAAVGHYPQEEAPAAVIAAILGEDGTPG